MTEVIFIIAIASLIAPLTFIKEISKQVCMLLLLTSIVPVILTAHPLYMEAGVVGVKELVITYSFCLILNIDNIISYIVVVEGFDATKEEKDKAINFAILSAIFFREILIFVGMSLSGYPVLIFKIFTALLSIFVWRKIYMQSDFVKTNDETESTNTNNEKNLPVNYNPNFRFSKIVTIIIFAESLFSLDSTNMIITSTQDPKIAHIANLAAMCTLKPITTLIQITNRNNKYLEDRIWVPVVFVLTKTILWG